MFEQFVGPGLYVKLGLDSSGLVTGLDQVKGKLTQWRDETNQSTRDMAKWGAAITATMAPIMAVGTAAYLAIERYGGMANSLKDLSYQTGVNTSQLQRMQYAAVLSGTDFNRVAFSLNQLSLSMAAVQDPTSKAYKAFMGIGIDPRGKTVDQVFELTASALVNMHDETRRNALAMDLYGRSWKELLPYMETYITKSDEIKKHPVLSEDDLKTLQDSKIAIDKLTQSVELYIAKLVVAGEKALKPFGETTLGPTGITETRGGGRFDEATSIMAKLYGPLTPEILHIPPKFTPSDLGLPADKKYSAAQMEEIGKGIIQNPELVSMLAAGSRTAYPVTVNIGTVVTKDPEDLAKKVGDVLQAQFTRARMAQGYMG